MDAVLLARIQFALTVGFHFLFPPVTIGLAWIIVIIEYRYLRSGEEIYKSMSKFWIKVLGLIFAVGVATGITMEFQFGTNWSEYSRFVGDIFGAPLAAEGIFAFFLESSFLGILLLGRERVSRRAYWLSTLLVAFGSTLSGLWILIANSWQQTPAGYQVVEGRAVLTDFWAAAFNPSILPRFTHTITASLITGAFFVAAISAWYLLQGRHVEFARRSLTIAIVFAAVFSITELGLGHLHSVQVWETQPVKMAAFEGLFETGKGVGLALFGFPDAEQGTTHLKVAVPYLLSLLLGFDPNTEVLGLSEFPRDEWPPLMATFQSYHIMIALGVYFILVSWVGLYLLYRKRLFESKRYLRLLLYSLPLPWVACEFGWLAAEIGRQPWVVYGELKTVDAASVVVPAGQVLFTLIMFVLIYALLLALIVYLVTREIKHGPDSVAEAAATTAQEVAT
jgi:cytochrome d ubiquinol oxidase subunit I